MKVYLALLLVPYIIYNVFLWKRIGFNFAKIGFAVGVLLYVSLPTFLSTHRIL